MAFAVSPSFTIEPITGLRQPSVTIFTTQAGVVMVPQVTGEPPGGLNTLPGTFTPLPTGQSVGLPYGFLSIPSTGPIS